MKQSLIIELLTMAFAVIVVVFLVRIQNEFGFEASVIVALSIIVAKSIIKND